MSFVSKYKRYIFLSVEFIALVILAQYALTDGFTKTLDETLGLNSGNSFDSILGSPDITKVLIGIIALAIFFVSYLFVTKKKK